MSAEMVMSGIGGKNRLFTTAVTVSLLMHLVLLWWWPMLTSGGKVQSTAPVYSPIEVALAPARTTQERTVVQRESRPQQRINAPVRPLPDVVKTEPAREQASATQEDASTEESSEQAGSSEGGSETPVQSSGAVDTTARDRYLATVLAHIESHKYYPLPARRRGMQGRVNVKFTLDARGMISGLDVTGNNSLFVEAARAAIQNALPLPTAPSLDDFPLVISYQMLYSLK